MLVGLVGVVPAAAVAQAPAWTWPLPGPHEVGRPFAPPATRYSAGHRGADLPGAPGLVVRAAGAGRVSYAGLLAGRGVVVVVHGDLRTTYEPVTASVAVGASVAAGDQIGRLDAAHLGCPVAACLHWGLRRGEDYLDPVSLVDRWPTRLLPLGDAAAGGPVPEHPGRAARSDGATEVPRGAGPPARSESYPGPTGPAVPATGDTAVPGEEPGQDPRRTAGTGGWSLRAAQTPLGFAALAALVAGIGLRARARPRPGPEGPASEAGAVPAVLEPGSDAVVLQLDEERLRRRAG